MAAAASGNLGIPFRVPAMGSKILAVPRKMAVFCVQNRQIQHFLGES